MDIACQCAGCGALFKLDSRHLGRKAKCPQCGHIAVATAAPEPTTSAGESTAAAANRRRFAPASMSDDQITAPDISPEELGLASKVVVTNPGAADPQTAKPSSAKSGFAKPPGASLAGTTAAGATPAGTTPAGTTPAGTTPANATPAGAPKVPIGSKAPAGPKPAAAGASAGSAAATATAAALSAAALNASATGTAPVAVAASGASGASGVAGGAGATGSSGSAAGGTAGDAAFAGVVLRPTERSGASRPPRRGRGGSRLAWVIGGGVAGLVLAIGSVVAVVISLSSGGGQPVVNAARSQAKLLLDLPVEGRRNMKLVVDAKAWTIPATGSVEVPLAAGTHKLTIQRRGFQQIDHSFTLRRGEHLPFAPDWEASLAPPIAAVGAGGSGMSAGGDPAAGDGAIGPAAGGPGASGTGAGSAGAAGGQLAGGGLGGGPGSGGVDGGTSGPTGFPAWSQNFEVAQKTALASGRDIFVVFAGSDWSQQTQAMAAAIFSQPRFRSFVEQRFVPIVIDLPRTSAGFNQLENVSQNRALSRQFGVRSVPVVLLMDAGGTPYAADGFFGDSLDKYIQHITLLQNKRAQRDVRLEAVDKARNKPPQEQLEAMQQAVNWIDQERLTAHYGTVFARWLMVARQLDPQNELGKFEVFFEADWVARLSEAMVDGERTKVAGVLGDLLNWSKSRKFADPDRAVRNHLLSAMLLIQTMDDEEAAVRHIDLARTYTPADSKLKDELANVEKWARQREQLSSGTGFVVAAEGFILTNHHVIDGPGRTVVRVPSPVSDDPAKPAPDGGNEAQAANDPAGMRNVPAVVVASDPKRDIALLKVDPSAFSAFKPLPLGGERVRRGADVAVFGFPLGDELGKDVRITTGVVHSPSDQSDEKRHVLDCRINPGNSGGPVLNRFGHVIGMVTAKTVGGAGVDSYGVAIPSTELHAFLTQYLPANVVQPLATADPAPMQRREWEEIDAAVSPGVLMVLKLKQ